MKYSIKQALALGILGLGIFVFTTVSLPAFKRELFPPAMGIGGPSIGSQVTRANPTQAPKWITRTPRSLAYENGRPRPEVFRHRRHRHRKKHKSWEWWLSLCSNVFGTAAPPISLGYSAVLWLRRRREKKIDSNPTV